MKPNFTEEARIWERGVVPAKTLAMLLREMWERGEVAGAGDRAALLAEIDCAPAIAVKLREMADRWEDHPDECLCGFRVSVEALKELRAEADRIDALKGEP